MKRPNAVQREKDENEMFLTIPSESLPGAESFLSEVFKINFQTVPRRSKNGKLGIGFKLNSQKLLVDLSALHVSKIPFNKAAVDCDLLRAAITNHPEEIRKVAATLLSGEVSSKELDGAVKLLKKLGLAEEEASHKGGGIGWLVVVAVIVIIAIAARSCNPKDKIIE